MRFLLGWALGTMVPWAHPSKKRIKNILYNIDLFNMDVVQMTQGRGKFWGLYSSFKSIGSLCSDLRCKRYH